MEQTFIECLLYADTGLGDGLYRGEGLTSKEASMV